MTELYEKDGRKLPARPAITLPAFLRNGPLFFLVLCGLFPAVPRAACLNNVWEMSTIWPKDCTPGTEFDGRYMDAGNDTAPVAQLSGSVQVAIGGGVTKTLSWRLHYWESKFAQSRTNDSLPFLLVLHSWHDGASINELLNQEEAKMVYEGAWEDVIILSVAIENGNDDNTWWWGYRVNPVNTGTPTPWAENAILSLLKTRLTDAASLLYAQGATKLNGKRINTNRVYLYGSSMGGTGTMHMGIKHPEIFAAIHADAGFSDYLGPCGAFCTWFNSGFIGSAAENLNTKGLDSANYNARNYTDMRWFVSDHKGRSWELGPGAGKKFEPPYVFISHGKADSSVNIASVNRLWTALAARRFGASLYRHTGDHGGYGYIKWQALANFRKDQSYLAFTNNSTDVKTTNTAETYNFLDKVGWNVNSVSDVSNRYSVMLTGNGTVDVTVRRLQRFTVAPLQAFNYWLGATTGTGTTVTADSNGVITVAGVVVRDSILLTLAPKTSDVLPKEKKTVINFSAGQNGDFLDLQYAFDRGGLAGLEIRNVAGKVLLNLSVNLKSSGVYRLPLRTLAPALGGGGVLVIRLMEGGKPLARKLVTIHG